MLLGIWTWGPLMASFPSNPMTQKFWKGSSQIDSGYVLA
jgi:hypothetical protein